MYTESSSIAIFNSLFSFSIGAYRQPPNKLGVGEYDAMERKVYDPFPRFQERKRAPMLEETRHPLTGRRQSHSTAWPSVQCSIFPSNNSWYCQLFHDRSRSRYLCRTQVKGVVPSTLTGCFDWSLPGYLPSLGAPVNALLQLASVASSRGRGSAVVGDGVGRGSTAASCLTSMELVLR